jgi:hypothetical protein
MPKSTFRSFVGIARETGNGVTVTATAAAGTSVTLGPDVRGAFANTNRITIYDGPLTETVVISAVATVGANTVLTVGAMTNAHGVGCLVTTLGTASTAPTDYIAVTKFDPADAQVLLEDKGWRGAMVEVYDLVAGPRSATIDLGGDVFCDTVGYVLGGLLGDVVFAGGTPNTHTFSTVNSFAGQAPSYQITDFYGQATWARQWGGVQFSEFGLKATGDGLLTYDAKATAYASGVVTIPSPTFSAARATPGYAGVVTLNSAAIAQLSSFDLTIKRAVEVIQNIDGGPDPYRVFDGTVSVDGKASYVMEDDTFLNYYLNNSQPPLSITWSIGSGAAQLALTVQMTKAAHKNAKVNRGKSYVAIETDLQGIANTTDAGASGGYSPVKMQLKNSKGTGTFG